MRRFVAPPLCLLVAAATASYTGVRLHAQSSGPVAAYAFSEGTGTTTADSSGNGNAGMLANGAAWTAGRIGSGVDLSATNANIQVPPSETLQLTTAFTFETWVRPATANANAWIWTVPVSGQFALRLSEGHPFFQIDLSGTGYRSAWAPQVLAANRWAHVTVTYDGTMLRIYVNGQAVGASAASGDLLPSTQSMSFGPVDGAIDDVRLYARALTADEVYLDMATPVDTTAPFQVTWFTPSDGAEGVRTAPVTATFSRALSEGTLSTATFELHDSGNALAPATVSYDAATRTATLTPSAALTPLTDYSVRVVSGSSGVLAADSDPLASDVTWTFRTATAATEPAAALPFSEGTGATTADASGNGNTGTLKDGAVWTNGRIGSGLDLSAGNAHVELPLSETLELTSAFTFEAWVYPTSSGATTSVWTKYVPNFFFDLGLEDGHPKFSLTTDETPYAAPYGPVALPVNAWTHLAGTYDGGMARLYVNGLDVAHEAVSGLVGRSTYQMTVGPFAGLVDEARVYARALTAAELLLDMTAPVDPASTFQLTARTPADGAVGTRAAVTATFSRAVNEATLSTATFELRDNGGTLVSATVSYDGPTRTATLVPVSPLSSLARYTARIVGGADGVQASSGDTLLADATWTFRTGSSLTDMVAAYTFSEGTGTTTADVSGNDNTGTLTDGPVWATGHAGGGVDLSSGNARVVLPLSDTLELTSAFTVEVWVYPTAAATSTVWTKPAAGFFELGIENGHPKFMLTTSGTAYIGPYAPDALPLETWSHLAASYDGSMARLYVNGTDVAHQEATGTLLTSPVPMAFGPFAGVIDDARLYARALTPTEIATDRDAPIVPACIYDVLPTSITSGADGSVGVISVTASGGSCAWTATSDVSWVTLGAPTGGYAGAVLHDQPTGYWRLGESSGTAAADRSGHLLSGSLVGGVTLQQGGALNDGDAAVELDGSTGNVQIPASSLLNFTSQLSVETWMKSAGTGQWQRLVAKGTDGVNMVWELWLTDAGKAVWSVSLTPNNSSVGNVESANSVTDGAWHHVVATLDTAGAQAIYVDGVLSSSQAASPTLLTNGEPVSFGADVGYAAGYFNGGLDEVALYNHVLTPEQVAAHYALRTATAATTGSGAVTFAVASNVDASPRQATLTVAGAPIAVSQTEAVTATCTATVTPTAVTSGAAGRTGTIQVTESDPSCTWTAASDAGWVTLGPVTQAFAGSVLADAPVGYWRLNESSGTTAADLSGNQLTAAAHDGVTWHATGALGDGDKAIALDGTGWLEVPLSAPLALTNAVTLEAWIKTVGTGTWQRIVGMGPNSVSPWQLRITAQGIPTLSLHTAEGNVGMNGYDALGVTDNQWHHIVATWDGAVARMYVDGLQDGHAEITGTLTSTPEDTLRIGSAPDYEMFFTGLIDEVAVYSHALTPQQVVAHYAQRASNGTSGSGAVAYTVAANAGEAFREATLTIAEHAVTVTQSPNCMFSVSPATISAGPSDQAGSINVTTTGACEWRATSDSPWITFNGVSNGYAEQVLLDAPTGYWRLDEQSGSSVADSSGHGLTGNINAGVTLGAPGAIQDFDTAITLDGSAGRVRVPANTALDFTSGLTIETWIKTTDYRYQRLVGKSGTFTGWDLFLDYAGQPYAYLGSSSTTAIPWSGISVNDGQWHHIALTWDGTTASILVDGVVAATAPFEGPLVVNATAPLYMGISYEFRGSMDEVAIYDHALTGEQIARHIALARSPATGHGSGATGFTIAPNPSPGSRTATLSIADHSIAVTQAGTSSCTFTPSMTSVTSAWDGSSAEITLTGPAGCAWTAAAGADWASVTPASGTGTATLRYVVNLNALTVPRETALVAAGQTISIAQDAAPACAYALSPESVNVAATGGQRTLTVSTRWGCAGMPSSTVPWIRVAPGGEYATTVLADVPSGYWRLGELSGSVAADSSSRHNDAEYIGSRTPGIAATRDGDTGVAFDGGFAQLNFNPIFFGSFTVEAWAQAATDVTGTVLGSWDGPAYGWALDLVNGRPKFHDDYGEDAHAFTVESTASIADGRWHHLVGVYDGSSSEARLFIDGVLQVSAPVDHNVPVTGGTAFDIGARDYGDSGYLTAAIDEVAVYQSVLNATQIATHFAAHGTVPLPTSGALDYPVSYSVQPNPAAFERTGTIALADQSLAVTQAAAPCTFTLMPESVIAPAIGQSGLIVVDTPTSCAWTTSTAASWLTLTKRGGFKEVVLGDNPAAYWRLGESDGTVAHDETTNALDGTYIGTFTLGQPSAMADGNTAVRFTPGSGGGGGGGDIVIDGGVGELFGDVFGSFSLSPPSFMLDDGGSSETLESSGGYVEATDSTLFNPSQQFSIEAWIKFTESQNGPIAVEGGGDGTFGLYVRGSNPSFEGSPSPLEGAFSVMSAQSLNDGDWHQIVGVYDQTTAQVQLYVDGLLDSTGSIYGQLVDGDRFAIATEPGSNQGRWNGTIDEVAFFRAGLTPEQIARHFAARHGTSDGGYGTVAYVATENPSTTHRTTTITVGPQALPFTQLSTCVFQLGETSALIVSAGGTGSVSLTASDAACNWNVVSNQPWLTPSTGGGAGSATVGYEIGTSVDPQTRVGTLTIADIPYTVTQQPACGYTVVPSSVSRSQTAGSGVFVVTTSDPSCTWSASTDLTWLTFADADTHSGSGSIGYTVTANTAGGTRSGAVTVAARNLAVSQEPRLIRYFYDELGRLKTVVDLNGDSATYSYDAVGNILSITRASASDVSISSIVPNRGAVGSVVRIAGSGFALTLSDNTVTFNGTPATVSSASSTELLVTVPTAATTGPITVTTQTGEATSSPFTVATGSDGPTITSFTPTVGVAGTPVTITGSNYEAVVANNNVSFNTTGAPIADVTSTTIQTVVPTNALGGRVRVRTPLGDAVSSVDFFVLPPPYSVSQVATTLRMAIGETRLVNIPGASVGLVLFDGQAGQRIGITFAGSNIPGAKFTLHAPNGTALATLSDVYSSTVISPVVLPATGTYTLFIGGRLGLAGNASISIYTLVDVLGTLTPGVPQPLTLDRPGQTARLSIQGVVGKRLSAVSTGGGNISIVAPNGSVIVEKQLLGYAYSDRTIETAPLTASGTYTIVLNFFTPSTTVVTGYVLEDIAGTIAVDGDPVAVATTIPAQNARYTFAGGTGQNLTLHVTDNTYYYNGYYVEVRVLSPGGTELVRATGYLSTFDLTVPTFQQSGTYTITVDAFGEEIGSLTLTLTSQ